MAITEKSIKLLWTGSGGRCAFPGCWERLCYQEAADAAPYTIGEMAHICGDKPGANRHDGSQTPKQRDDYANLILLCPTHHTLIDRKENEGAYPADALHKIKSAHEVTVLKIMDGGQGMGRQQVFSEILALLEENRQSWSQYGPLSELAKSQPNSDAAHAVWISERLSIIVPNNRKISAILRAHRAVFQPGELQPVALFLIHARSYERWVEDEIPYAAVVRFPAAFESAIREAIDGGFQ